GGGPRRGGVQGHGGPVGRGPGQPGRAHQLSQRGRPRLHGVQHGNGLVQDANSARVVHVLILPSRNARRNRNGETATTLGNGPERKARWAARWPRKSGMPTWCTAPRASPICSTLTCTWCT